MFSIVHKYRKYVVVRIAIALSKRISVIQISSYGHTWIMMDAADQVLWRKKDAWSEVKIGA